MHSQIDKCCTGWMYTSIFNAYSHYVFILYKLHWLMQVYLPLSSKSEIIMQHSASIVKTVGTRCVPCFALLRSPPRPRPLPLGAPASTGLAIFTVDVEAFLDVLLVAPAKKESLWSELVRQSCKSYFELMLSWLLISGLAEATNWNRDTPFSLSVCVCDNFIRLKVEKGKEKWT